MQSLEPAGVGARNVQECLLLQIGRDPDADGSAQRIVRDCFSDLERGRLPRISAQLGMTPEELKKSLRYIRALNPRPGLAYGSGAAPYVQPDAVIVRKQDGYHVVINEANCPKLSLSEYYRNMLGSDEYISAYGYLRTNLDSAEWLLRSLGKRKKTLQKVIRSIVEEQQAFFDGGIAYLKPLNLKTVAARLGLHESTVSRAVQNKVVRTPHGLFELKFFFSSGLSTYEGEGASSERIKFIIRQWIEDEDKGAPLSDQGITDLLAAEGIRISRRTVMKYREEMGVLSSRLRKQIKM